MATRLYCDKCGADITNHTPFAKLTVRTFSVTWISFLFQHHDGYPSCSYDYRPDLCEACTDKIRSYIGKVDEIPPEDAKRLAASLRRVLHAGRVNENNAHDNPNWKPAFDDAVNLLAELGV